VECAIPFADYATVDRAANKVDLMETARALGVPVPRSVVVTSPSDVPTGLAFPVVVKPWRSRVRVGSGWESTAVSHAADAEELDRDLSARHGYEFPVMLQERIVGPGMGVFAIYDRGRPIAFFSHRRLREKPPWGGVSVLSESVPLPPDATASATRLLNALQWHGVAMVEFKRDVRDGVPKLMEINGRFWGSLQLAIDAGVDFPALLVDGVKGRMTPPAPYEVGVRSRWWWGDVDALLLRLAGRGPHGASSLKDRLRALGPFLFPLGRRLYYENPRWQDLGPGIFESYRWLSAIVRPRPRPRAAASRPVAVAKRATIER
jgi:predicted ATP-grasp superfamily ATP-dependent carboligase